MVGAPPMSVNSGPGSTAGRNALRQIPGLLCLAVLPAYSCGQAATDAATDSTLTGTDAASTDAAFNSDAASDSSMTLPESGTDAAVGCSVGGVPGTCVDVSLCAGVSTPGFCPGPANIQCCTTGVVGSCDPTVMPLPNAGLTEPLGVGGCPAGMVPVESFCIDRYEASLDGWSPYFNPGTAVVTAVSLPAAVPQGYISGDQAAAACITAGKRLCTDTEWLRACRGPAMTTYPYGDVLMPGVCNDARAVHPAIELFGTTDPIIWSMLGHPCLNQLADSLAPTGDHPGCVTTEGVHDMMGNLHEWTADPAGTFRGGFYVDTVINGSGCLYATTAHNTSHWDYSTGFRCCADP